MPVEQAYHVQEDERHSLEWWRVKAGFKSRQSLADALAKEPKERSVQPSTLYHAEKGLHISRNSALIIIQFLEVHGLKGLDLKNVEGLDIGDWKRGTGPNPASRRSRAGFYDKREQGERESA